MLPTDCPPLSAPAAGAATPLDAAGLAQLLHSQLASLATEAAEITAAAAGASSLPLSSAHGAEAGMAAQTAPLAADTSPAADCRLAEATTQHSLLPSVGSMRSTLQALTANLAPARRKSAAAQRAGGNTQDAACGTTPTPCHDAATGDAGNEAASQTKGTAGRGPTATQPATSPRSAGNVLSQSESADGADATTRRAAKWKARCHELRRALAASREAAVLCASLKVINLHCIKPCTCRMHPLSCTYCAYVVNEPPVCTCHSPWRPSRCMTFGALKVPMLTGV